MKYTSDLLYRLGRGIGSVEFDARDSTREVLTTLSPTVTIPGPFDRGVVAPATLIQRESFLFESAATLAASQAETTVTVLTLGRGLWRIMITLMYHADYTAIPGTTGGVVVLQDPLPVGGGLMRFPPIANVSQLATLTFEGLFPIDSWVIRRIQGATGVGQTSRIQVEGFALRLS